MIERLPLPDWPIFVRSDYYTYILFDPSATPRYVGKGTKNRWNAHDTDESGTNPRKEEFIKETLAILGEIPKIKIAENLTQEEALELESIFIHAIGIYPDGPLTNLTYNACGATSESIIRWHESMTAEENAAIIAKAMATRKERYTKEEWAEIARKNALAQGSEAISAQAKIRQAAIPEKDRIEHARKMGLSSNAKRPKEEKIKRGKHLAECFKKYVESLSPDERVEFFSGRAKNFSGGIQKNTNKDGLQDLESLIDGKTPEQRREYARRAGLAAQAAKRKRRQEEIDKIELLTRFTKSELEPPTK
jgi:hypothetical protein